MAARTVKHIPTRFSGAGFKRDAIVWKAKMLEMVNKPYERVKEEMVRAHFPTARLFVYTLLSTEERDSYSVPLLNSNRRRQSRGIVRLYERV